MEELYRSPRHGNPTDPFDDLVYIILSNRTGPAVAQRVYCSLRERLPRWRDLLSLSEAELVKLLVPGGLAIRRARQLRCLVHQLVSDFGDATLDPLAAWPEDEAEAYLTALPGVSLKVAKCVLMYTLGREVLPVDVHIHRITRRLGWHGHKRADQSHDTLEGLVPPNRRYSFHVNCIAHGRAICRPHAPRCGECRLAPLCDFAETKDAETDDGIA